MPIFIAAIFASAFLLFQVQPIIARYILPWYGGSPAVWTACMLFFQVGLLAGYSYAHFLVSAFREKRTLQVAIHLGLILLSCVMLPITPDDSMKPEGTESNPVMGIIQLLAGTVGFPYLIIAASGPLLQHWFGEVHPGKSPYRLYAVSNFGSLLGLISYPFLFEPLLSLPQQTGWWSVGYIVYGVLAALCGWGLWKQRDVAAPVAKEASVASEVAGPDRPSWINRILWVLFPACGSILLLALTNQMCQDVAVVPFLWVLPLGLYLTTFIISFDHARWYSRWFWMIFAVIAFGLLVYLLNQEFADEEMHISYQIAVYMAALFTGCMICHGEVVRVKPNPRYLTSFYLAVSLGGAIGGVLVSLVAPQLFTGYWELHFGLLFLALLITFVLARDCQKICPPVPIWAAAIIWLFPVCLLCIGLEKHYEERNADSVTSKRSFYGVLTVYEGAIGTKDYYKALYHGRITHGRQYFNESYRELATTYYGPDSGIAAFFDNYASRLDEDDPKPMKYAVVGLGVGTLATFAKEGDEVLFYEINPQVEELAREQFHYLEDCKGKVEVVPGDARITMERELREHGSNQFDALFVDAFSGDSIPIHLLTEESFDLYWQHIKPGGVLIVHITNIHLDLSDPVRRLSEKFGKEAILIEHIPDDDDHTYSSDWVLIADDPDFLQRIDRDYRKSRWRKLEPDEIDWTDHYSNLLDVVIWDDDYYSTYEEDFLE